MNSKSYAPIFGLILLTGFCGLNLSATDTTTGTATPALTSATTAAKPAAKPEVTPVSIPSSEPFVFRSVGTSDLRLFVVKPKGWTKSDRRPCMVCFFGGGWISGTPEHSISWAKWAASNGLVGVAPDYRTRSRFGGTPEDCVSDGRAAVRWVEEHADELGIDPAKIVAQGSSAGGHVAAWTAIPSAGPGQDDPAPKILPAALVLLNPVTDTKEGGYGGPKRFGGDAARALACSVPDQMPARMPPTIIFHATADQTVPYANSVAFRDKLVANSNRCELVTFEGLGHSYNSSKYGEAGKAADQKTREAVARFLTSLGLVEAGGDLAATHSLAQHDASKWRNEIAAFESADATNPPPRGCIVFTGSSYIRKWTTLAADFPGVPVINRGFGGCHLADVCAYADRIVIAYAPREVVIYAGGNDIDSGLPPELVFGDFVALMTKLRQALPQAKLVFISCPPSPKRWAETDQIETVNGLIAGYCREHGLTFVDTFSLMLGADGQPKPEIYVEDRLHMNETGYAIWKKAVAPCLQ